MLKGEQVLMGLKSYKEEATQNKRVNAKTKQQKKKKKGFLGNSITHARTGLCTQNQVCVCKLDHAYVDPHPENLKMQKQSLNACLAKAQ